MARIRYRDIEFRADRAERIVQMNTILTEYEGSRVSVRQLYYRLVAAGLIANQQEEYSKIQALITDARYAGLIDWSAIEDRNREPSKPQDYKDGHAVLDLAAQSFRLDRWRDQPFYMELWVEKAALAGVLAPISDDYHVTLMVNRGYSSASAMKESADRIRFRGLARRPTILYIGDHDPSGLDMVRDIRDRLIEFGCPSWLDVRHLALTTEQVEEYDPPPNPAKITDSRAAAYIERFGESSWEVDALPPKVLDALVRKTLNAYIDKKKMDAVISEENQIKARIKKVALDFNK